MYNVYTTNRYEENATLAPTGYLFTKKRKKI